MRYGPTLALAIAAMAFSPASAADAPTTQPTDDVAPLVAGGTAWLNVKRPPTAADLAGRVVLLDFWDFTCVNCIRTLPYLKMWHERYAAHGLVIIGVHMPEFSFAHDPGAVARGVAAFKLPYPVVLDNGLKIWGRYNDPKRLVWPYKLLLGPGGKVIARHRGEGGYVQTEQEIQAELRKLHPDLELPAVTEPARAEDRDGAWRRKHPQTPELYANWRGVISRQFAHRVDARNEADYAVAEKLTDDKLHLAGRWRVRREYAQPAAGQKAFAPALALPFQANTVNVVLRPLQEPAGDAPTTQPAAPRVRVTVDGRPLTKADAGADIELADGASWVRVDAGRMYRLYDAEVWGRHTLRLELEDQRVGVFAFTFGSRVKAE